MAALAYLSVSYSTIARVLKGDTNSLVNIPYLSNISLSSDILVVYGIFLTNSIVLLLLHTALSVLFN